MNTTEIGFISCATFFEELTHLRINICGPVGYILQEFTNAGLQKLSVQRMSSQLHRKATLSTLLAQSSISILAMFSISNVTL